MYLLKEKSKVSNRFTNNGDVAALHKKSKCRRWTQNRLLLSRLTNNWNVFVELSFLLQSFSYLLVGDMCNRFIPHFTERLFTTYSPLVYMLIRNILPFETELLLRFQISEKNLEKFLVTLVCLVRVTKLGPHALNWIKPTRLQNYIYQNTGAARFFNIWTSLINHLKFKSPRTH